jgi:hypothetical protein
MRGRVDEQPLLFHVFSVEERIRPDHPLREVKQRVDAILAAMDAQFTAAYRSTGRPSVPPAELLECVGYADHFFLQYAVPALMWP